MTMGGQFSGTNPGISPPTGSQPCPVICDPSSPIPNNHNIQYLYAIILKQLMTGHLKTRQSILCSAGLMKYALSIMK